MDYDYNKQFTQKSNTGFWIIALLTLLLCGYMVYTHLMGFANAGFNAIDSYAYGLTDQTAESRMKSSSSAFLNIIFAGIYTILFLSTVFAVFTKKIKLLMGSFLFALILTLLVFILL